MDPRVFEVAKVLNLPGDIAYEINKRMKSSQGKPCLSPDVTIREFHVPMAPKDPRRYAGKQKALSCNPTLDFRVRMHAPHGQMRYQIFGRDYLPLCFRDKLSRDQPGAAQQQGVSLDAIRIQISCLTRDIKILGGASWRKVPLSVLDKNIDGNVLDAYLFRQLLRMIVRSVEAKPT